MNPVPLFLIIVLLPLLLGGCVEKHDGVNTEGVELRDGIAYLNGLDTPYTGCIKTGGSLLKETIRTVNRKA